MENNQQGLEELRCNLDKVIQDRLSALDYNADTKDSGYKFKILNAMIYNLAHECKVDQCLEEENVKESKALLFNYAKRELEVLELVNQRVLWEIKDAESCLIGGKVTNSGGLAAIKAIADKIELDSRYIHANGDYYVAISDNNNSYMLNMVKFIENNIMMDCGDVDDDSISKHKVTTTDYPLMLRAGKKTLCKDYDSLILSRFFTATTIDKRNQASRNTGKECEISK